MCESSPTRSQPTVKNTIKIDQKNSNGKVVTELAKTHTENYITGTIDKK